MLKPMDMSEICFVFERHSANTIYWTRKNT